LKRESLMLLIIMLTSISGNLSAGASTIQIDILGDTVSVCPGTSGDVMFRVTNSGDEKTISISVSGVPYGWGTQLAFKVSYSRGFREGGSIDLNSDGDYDDYWIVSHSRDTISVDDPSTRSLDYPSLQEGDYFSLGPITYRILEINENYVYFSVPRGELKMNSMSEVQLSLLVEVPENAVSNIQVPIQTTTYVIDQGGDGVEGQYTFHIGRKGLFSVSNKYYLGSVNELLLGLDLNSDGDPFDSFNFAVSDPNEDGLYETFSIDLDSDGDFSEEKVLESWDEVSGYPVIVFPDASLLIFLFPREEEISIEARSLEDPGDYSAISTSVRINNSFHIELGKIGEDDEVSQSVGDCEAALIEINVYLMGNTPDRIRLSYTGEANQNWKTLDFYQWIDLDKDGEVDYQLDQDCELISQELIRSRDLVLFPIDSDFDGIIDSYPAMKSFLIAIPKKGAYVGEKLSLEVEATSLGSISGENVCSPSEDRPGLVQDPWEYLVNLSVQGNCRAPLVEISQEFLEVGRNEEKCIPVLIKNESNFHDTISLSMSYESSGTWDVKIVGDCETEDQVSRIELAPGATGTYYLLIRPQNLLEGSYLKLHVIAESSCEKRSEDVVYLSVVEERDIEIEISPEEMELCPGERGTFNLIIRNEGNGENSVTIDFLSELVFPPIPPGGGEPGGPGGEPGEPLDPPGLFGWEVKAERNGREIRNLTLTPIDENGDGRIDSFKAATDYNGDSVIDEEWYCQDLDSDGVRDDCLVEVIVKPPENALEGTEANLTVRVTSEDGTVEEDYFRVKVLPRYQLDIEPESQSGIVEPNGTIVYTFLLKNEGNAVTEVELSASTEEGWSVWVDEDPSSSSGSLEYQLRMNPSETRTIYLHVSNSGSEESLEVSLIARPLHSSRCGVIQDSVNVKTYLTPARGIEAYFEDQDTGSWVKVSEREICPGEEITYEVNVKNFGNSAETVYVQYTPPPNGWFAELSSNQLEIRPGSSAKVYLKVKANERSYAESMAEIELKFCPRSDPRPEACSSVLTKTEVTRSSRFPLGECFFQVKIPYKWITPGEKEVFPIKVENPFNSAVKILLDHGPLPPGWEAWFSLDVNGTEIIDTLEIDPEVNNGLITDYGEKEIYFVVKAHPLAYAYEREGDELKVRISMWTEEEDVCHRYMNLSCPSDIELRVEKLCKIDDDLDGLIDEDPPGDSNGDENLDDDGDWIAEKDDFNGNGVPDYWERHVDEDPPIVSILPYRQRLTITPGGEVLFPVTIENYGNSWDTIVLGNGPIPSGFSIEYQRSIELPPRTSQTIGVKVVSEAKRLPKIAYIGNGGPMKEILEILSSLDYEYDEYNSREVSNLNLEDYDVLVIEEGALGQEEVYNSLMEMSLEIEEWLRDGGGILIALQNYDKWDWLPSELYSDETGTLSLGRLKTISVRIKDKDHPVFNEPNQISEEYMNSFSHEHSEFLEMPSSYRVLVENSNGGPVTVIGSYWAGSVLINLDEVVLPENSWEFFQNVIEYLSPGTGSTHLAGEYSLRIYGTSTECGLKSNDSELIVQVEKECSIILELEDDQEKEISPGGVEEFRMRLTSYSNTGNEVEFLVFPKGRSTGWNFSIRDYLGNPVEKVYLEPIDQNEDGLIDSYPSVYLYLRVEAPDYLPSDEEIGLEVMAVSDLYCSSSLELKVTSSPTHGVDLEPERQEKAVQRCGSTSFEFTVRNTGNTRENVALSYEVPDGWAVFLSKDTLTLLPDEHEDVTALVLAPCLDEGSAEIVIRGTVVEKPTEYDEITLAPFISEERVDCGVDLEPETQEKIITPGGERSLSIRVRNTGINPDIVEISCSIVEENPVGWGILCPSSVSLNPGEEKTVTVRVTAPESDTGEARILVKGVTTSCLENKEDSVELLLEISEHCLELIPEVREESIPIGTSEKYDFWVQNCGMVEEEVNVSLTEVTSDPQGWEYCCPETLSIRPGEMKRYSLNVISPPEPGKLELNVRASNSVEDSSKLILTSYDPGECDLRLTPKNWKILYDGSAPFSLEVLGDGEAEIEWRLQVYKGGDLISTDGWEVIGIPNKIQAPGSVQFNVNPPGIRESIGEVAFLEVTAEIDQCRIRKVVTIEIVPGIPVYPEIASKMGSMVGLQAEYVQLGDIELTPGESFRVVGTEGEEYEVTLLDVQPYGVLIRIRQLSPWPEEAFSYIQPETGEYLYSPDSKVRVSVKEVDFMSGRATLSIEAPSGFTLGYTTREDGDIIPSPYTYPLGYRIGDPEMEEEEVCAMLSNVSLPSGWGLLARYDSRELSTYPVCTIIGGGKQSWLEIAVDVPLEECGFTGNVSIEIEFESEVPLVSMGPDEITCEPFNGKYSCILEISRELRVNYEGGKIEIIKEGVDTENLEATYSIEISNTGECITSYTLNISGDCEVSQRTVSTPPLEPGETYFSSISVAIPSQGCCTLSLDLVTADKLLDSEHLEVCWDEACEIALEPGESERQVKPGETAIHSFKLRNTGVENEVNLSLEGQLPYGWRYRILVDGEESDRITIGPGEEKDIEVEIEVPEGEMLSVPLSLVADPVCGEPVMSHLYTTVLPEACVTMRVEPEAISLRPGEEETIRVYIENCGNISDCYLVKFSSPEGCEVPEQREVCLIPGESTVLEVPIRGGEASCTIRIDVYSESDQTIRETAEVFVNVGLPDIGLEDVSVDPIIGEPGEIVSIKLLVKNYGSVAIGPEERAKLELLLEDSSISWDIPSLAPGEEREFTYTYRLPVKEGEIVTGLARVSCVGEKNLANNEKKMEMKVRGIWNIGSERVRVGECLKIGDLEIAVLEVDQYGGRARIGVENGESFDEWIELGEEVEIDLKRDVKLYLEVDDIEILPYQPFGGGEVRLKIKVSEEKLFYSELEENESFSKKSAVGIDYNLVLRHLEEDRAEVLLEGEEVSFTVELEKGDVYEDEGIEMGLITTSEEKAKLAVYVVPFFSEDVSPGACELFPSDMDRDGIPDLYDSCPMEPGSWEYMGCPPPGEIPEEGEPQIEGEIQVDKTQASEGEEISVEVVLTNRGSGRAEEVESRANLPPGLEVIGGSDYWTGSIDPGESVSYTYKVRGTREGTYTIQNVVFYKEKGVERSFLTPPVTVEINPAGGVMIFGNKRIEPSLVYLGDSAQVKITVRNGGEGTAKSVRIKDECPQDFDIQGNPSKYIEELAPGQSTSLTYFLIPKAPGEYLIPDAEVSYLEDGIYKTMRLRGESILVVGTPELRIIKEVTSNEGKEVSEEFEVSLKLKNEGNDSAFEVVVRDEIPDGIVEESGLKYIFKRIDEIKPGEEKTISYRLKVVDPKEEYELGSAEVVFKDRAGKEFRQESNTLTVRYKARGWIWLLLLLIAIILLGILIAIDQDRKRKGKKGIFESIRSRSRRKGKREGAREILVPKVLAGG